MQHAFKILDWYENLMKEEVPPDWMWSVDHELELWFEEVERRREEKYGRNRGDSGEESPGMMSNELADEIRGKR